MNESTELDDLCNETSVIDKRKDAREEKKSARVTWGGNYEFVLSLIGYTVGLGNIWRFPYICYRNGGGTFIIPFVLFLVLCCCPMYYMEACLGQFSGKSIVNVWSVCPLVKGIGVTLTFVQSLYVYCYGLVMAWIIYYLFRSCFPDLGWASCGNKWNTPLCRDGSSIPLNNETLMKGFNESNDVTGPNITMALNENNVTVDGLGFTTPGLEFWLYNVLGQSSGLEEVGSIQWHLVVCLLVGWTLSFFCLSKGIKTVGKVVYVTAILPYFLLTVLLIRAVTLDGATDGLSWFLEVDFSRMLHGQIWIEAAVQVFYSLGTAGGCVITMASFNKFNHNILRDTIIVCVADFFTAIYGAIIVFSVVGFLAKDMAIAKESVDFSGPGLAFIAYPAALSRLPIPHFWSVLFFLTLVLLGLDTQFATFETVVNAIIDMRYSTFHKYRTYITATLIGIFCLAGLPFCFSNGIYIFNLLDWYMLTFSITFVGVIETVAVCWVYGANRLSDDIVTMIGKRTPLPVRLSWAIVAPVFMGAIFLMTIFSHTAPTGNYTYPTYAIVFGNILAIGPMVLTVVIAVYEVIHRKGTLRKRMVAATRPGASWEPNDDYQAAIYKSSPYRYEPTLLRRIAIDVLGLKKK